MLSSLSSSLSLRRERLGEGGSYLKASLILSKIIDCYLTKNTGYGLVIANLPLVS